MPIKKSAFKALRQSDKRALRNKKVLLKIKDLTRHLRKFLENKETDKAKEVFASLVKTVDKAAQKKVIKKNTAARKKSRAAKKINTVAK